MFKSEQAQESRSRREMRRNGKSVGKTVRNQSRSPDLRLQILQKEMKASQKSIGSEKTEKNVFQGTSLLLSKILKLN